MSPVFSVTAPRAVRFMLAILAVLLALTVVAVHQTRAQTTVTVADGNVQGLITAIEDANSSSGSVTIELASSGDYVLTAPYTGGGQSGSNGLPLISGEIIIEGHGATIRRDPDSNNFRIFGIASTGDLHLEGVIVSGGWTQFDGGGIFNGGSLTLTDSGIINNSGFSGGGIFVFNNATVEMTDTHISDNMSGFGGGGISVISNSTAEMTDSVISGNTTVFGAGGGISISQSEVILIRSTVDGNVAENGGGIGSLFGVGDKVTLSNSTISGNSASNSGGGIYNSANGEVTLSNSTVSGNTSGEHGGGISNLGGEVTLANSTISGNTAEGDGGGIFNSEGNLTLTDSSIINNAAGGYDGGGIFASNNATVEMEGGTLGGNTAASDGGGLRIFINSTAKFTNVTISGNTAEYDGGGISNSSAEVTLTNSTVSGNKVGSHRGEGGGITVWSGKVSLISSTVSGNEARFAGGIANNSGELTLTNSTVTDNLVTSDSGGGISSRGGYVLMLTGSIVAGNTATDNGDTVGSNISGSIDSNIASFIDGDPELGPLQDNGGPTETHLPLPESPVLNQIPDGDHGCGIAGQIDTDQRGVPRPQGTHCDIGAVERFVGFNHLEQIVNPWFWATWARTDLPVRDGHVSRTWMWGPGPFTTSIWEPYTTVAQNPGGDPVFLSGIPELKREVIYFDKARMEINDPDGDSDSIWFVTNGLLVIEMITGNRQFGDDLFKHYEPSHSNVAGDADDIHGPTYASFQSVLDAPAQPVGTLLTGQIDRSGNVTSSGSWGDYNVTVGHVDNVTDHGIAGPFWEFMNSQGLVYEDGAMFEDDLFENPFYATGRPVTEAYWADVKVAGEQRGVLIQCFERRCLTYTPGNPAGFIVEAGNVGQHYYFWRYIQAPD